MNGTLSFYDCRLGVGDTQILPTVIKFGPFFVIGTFDVFELFKRHV